MSAMRPAGVVEARQGRYRYICPNCKRDLVRLTRFKEHIVWGQEYENDVFYLIGEQHRKYYCGKCRETFYA